MQDLIKKKLKSLQTIYLNIFKYFITTQKLINQTNLQTTKKIAKKTTKILIIVRKLTTKNLVDTYKVFRNLANIYEHQNYQISSQKSFRKSSQKSSQKTNI